MEKLANPARRQLFRGKVQKTNVLRLPWVISDAVFIEQCTQCQACVSACETKIIVRDEQGFPRIDFSKGECTFCNKCIESCDEPLFSLPIETTVQQKPWPVAFDISNNCLAKNNIYCQSCRDECEPNAIKFTYHNAGITTSIPQPNINLDDCTQCGACISTCPQTAISALFITASQQEIKNA